MPNADVRTSTRTNRRAVTAAPVVLALMALVGCTDNASTVDDASDDGTIVVSSTNDECSLSRTTAPSGNVVFSITNDGDEVTEFYLLGDDGLRIVGEVENIGPGLTRNLVVRASPGEYFTTCKPGMTGDGIRDAFSVSDGGDGDQVADPDLSDLLLTATDQYEMYVRDQVEQLVTGTVAFAEAYAAGDDDAARGLYASTRMHWERIEPVAESFGDLDPRLDLREADLEVGQVWTGWHAIEKDLWPPAIGYSSLDPTARAALAQQLVADTEDLAGRVQDLDLDATQLGNGAKELLDEVATGKVTGEEEAWSHTDLWDFQANVDGARIAFENLRPALETKDPELAETLDSRFESLQVLLDEHRVGDGFELYTALDADEIRHLADGVNALSEPLAGLTAAVVL